jgi:UDP-N-acetylmuramyl pentapeptide phosphotransferase/UDP-N-acetylglucosamine-1-phosphate transferase
VQQARVDADPVARGEHPRRTPVYGGLLIVAAMVGATVVWTQGGGLPGWLRATLMVLTLPVAIAGWLMTFRDLSNPRRRRPPGSR